MRRKKYITDINSHSKGHFVDRLLLFHRDEVLVMTLAAGCAVMTASTSYISTILFNNSKNTRQTAHCGSRWRACYLQQRVAIA